MDSAALRQRLPCSVQRVDKQTRRPTLGHALFIRLSSRKVLASLTAANEEQHEPEPERSNVDSDEEADGDDCRRLQVHVLAVISRVVQEVRVKEAWIHGSVRAVCHGEPELTNFL
eukprot:CAMPEP_0180038376 /NCGR_PEP_ID=MMETSP0984-20121128/32144_1 /TAXON_ID=483367 /ORGANISM="non described non described, Strain CCMP 2436" /LENGTH=114 /DNA_ID=CAMNT_0021965047 /DNA_START=247 /DNA_END=587 /DNA_ORIENTATION=-